MAKKAKVPIRPEQQEDQVITPGGPRPKDQVHPVKPGEVVRRNPDGTYTIVPTDNPKNQ